MKSTAKCRPKTSAHEQLTSIPFSDIICSVTRLRNQLKTMNKLHEWQRLKTTPTRDKINLLCMHLVLKSYKIS